MCEGCPVMIDHNKPGNPPDYIERGMWVVVDTQPDGPPEPGDLLPILFVSSSEQSASEFIETLPDHESGRYGLDKVGGGE